MRKRKKSNNGWAGDYLASGMLTADRLQAFCVGSSEDTGDPWLQQCCACPEHAQWWIIEPKCNTIREVSPQLTLYRDSDGGDGVSEGEVLEGPTLLYAQGGELSKHFSDAYASFSEKSHPEKKDWVSACFTFAGIGLEPDTEVPSETGSYLIRGGVGCAAGVSVVTDSDLQEGSVSLSSGGGLFFSESRGEPASSALTDMAIDPPKDMKGPRTFYLGATNGGLHTLSYALLDPDYTVCCATNISVEVVLAKLVTNAYYVAYGSADTLEVGLTPESHDPGGYTLYIDGTMYHYRALPPFQVVVSGLSAGEHTLTATPYTFPDLAVSATINVIKVEKIPLGGSANLSKFKIGKVYVPTKWGGELKLSGVNVELFYTDGADLDDDTAIQIAKGELDANRVAQGSPCVYEVPDYKHKWYYVKTSAAAGTSVLAGFIEWGEADVIPWNGWYWPLLNTRNPNLYDDSGGNTPLKDYDTIYGTNERAAEEANGSTSDTNATWEGHCWGWSLAAIAIPEPQALVKNNVTFTRDEMEGLYIELADGAPETGGWTWRVGSLPNNPIPAGPPTAATGEAVDAWADKVQKGLCEYIRQGHKAMNGNLRDATGADASEVWNHDVYKYESTMEEAGGGNEKVVKVTTRITSNTDGTIMPPATDKREDTYVYVLEYTGEGEIDGSSANQNWISCTGFAPRCLGTVNPLLIEWKAEHCGITKEKVDALYHP